MSDELARAFYLGVKAGEKYADEFEHWRNSGPIHKIQRTRPSRPESPYPTEETELTLTCHAMARFSAKGPEFWVEGRKVSRDEYQRFTWQPGNPVYYKLVEDWGLCLNCLTTDCGCCPGCGLTDADIDDSHLGGGYCVL